jgi:hypothetical protein
LEFTTSAANSQPQQISTNVTVKALTNTSLKNDGSSQQGPQTPQGQGQGQQQQSQPNAQQASNINKNNPSSNSNSNSHPHPNASPSPLLHQQQQQQQQQQNQLDLGNIVDFKQEPENDFADLKLSDLIGDNTNDESETFKELISDLSDFHSDSFLNFEDKPLLEIKPEDIKTEPHLQSNHQMQHSGMPLDNLGIKTNVGSPMQSQTPQQQQQQQYPNYMCPQDNNMNKRLPSFNQHSNNAPPMNELSPAAQTLKHMAEQHQHKSAMGNMGNYPRPNLQPQNGRTGYNEFPNQYPTNDYMNNMGQMQNQQTPFHKGSAMPFPGADLIKQEMMYPQNEFDLKRLQQMQQKQLSVNPGGVQVPNQNTFKQANQQYSPYGSPAGIGNLPNHGSPVSNFMPNRNQQQQQMPNNGTGSNRNSTGPNMNQNNMGQATVQMKQTLHISQQGAGHGIQVSSFLFKKIFIPPFAFKIVNYCYIFCLP